MLYKSVHKNYSNTSSTIANADSLGVQTVFKICLLALRKRNWSHHRVSPLKQHLNSDGAVIWGRGPGEFNQDVNNFYPFSQQWEKQKVIWMKRTIWITSRLVLRFQCGQSKRNYSPLNTNTTCIFRRYFGLVIRLSFYMLQKIIRCWRLL